MTETPVGCTWCGGPGTLRKIKVSGERLCPRCFQEFMQFGRRLTFREWLRLYHRAWAAQLRRALLILRMSLSVRRHWQIIHTARRFYRRRRLHR